MHFWVSTARLYSREPVPRKTSLNWFMPAFVKSSVGSSSGTTGDERTKVCPCFFTKKSMNCWRISFAEDMGFSSGDKAVALAMRGILKQDTGFVNQGWGRTLHLD